MGKHSRNSETEDDEKTLLREREARNTLRTVYLDDGNIIKDFRWLRGLGDLQKPWLREHRALKRLEQKGVLAPRSRGLKRLGWNVIRLERTYLAGQRIHELTEENTQRIAVHYAELHGALITMGDSSLDNYVRTEDGSVHSIDYGRARIFFLPSPLFYFNVGKELLRIRRRLYKHHPELWVLFCHVYRESYALSPWGLFFIKRATQTWAKNWNMDWTEVKWDRTLGR